MKGNIVKVKPYGLKVDDNTDQGFSNNVNISSFPSIERVAISVSSVGYNQTTVNMELGSKPQNGNLLVFINCGYADGGGSGEYASTLTMDNTNWLNATIWSEIQSGKTAFVELHYAFNIQNAGSNLTIKLANGAFLRYFVVLEYANFYRTSNPLNDVISYGVTNDSRDVIVSQNNSLIVGGLAFRPNDIPTVDTVGFNEVISNIGAGAFVVDWLSHDSGSEKCDYTVPFAANSKILAAFNQV